MIKASSILCTIYDWFVRVATYYNLIFHQLFAIRAYHITKLYIYTYTYILVVSI